MEQPLLTQDEYDRTYGDDHKRLPKLFHVEEVEISDFNTRKLDLLLSKTGLFHTSLLDALVRFNRTLASVKEAYAAGNVDAAMSSFESLKKQGTWILHHFQSAHKLVHGYYGLVRKMISTEGYIESWVEHEHPPFNNPALNAQYEKEVKELCYKVKMDLHQLMHLLYAMLTLFDDEVKILKEMVSHQMRKLNENSFNYFRASKLIDQMNVKFKEAVSKANSMHVVVDSSRSDLKVRESMVARAFSRGN